MHHLSILYVSPTPYHSYFYQSSCQWRDHCCRLVKAVFNKFPSTPLNPVTPRLCVHPFPPPPPSLYFRVRLEAPTSQIFFPSCAPPPRHNSSPLVNVEPIPSHSFVSSSFPSPSLPWTTFSRMRFPSSYYPLPKWKPLTFFSLRTSLTTVIFAVVADQTPPTTSDATPLLVPTLHLLLPNWILLNVVFSIPPLMTPPYSPLIPTRLK